MQKIEAEFEIVTPMFISGAEKTEPPEIRPPSIKGALRFWWRALQWGQVLQQVAGNKDQALQNLHEQEAILFGAAFKEEKYGQGLCTLKLTKVITTGVEKNWPSNNTGSGFLGYGLDKTNNEAHRQAISKGTFTVCLMLKKGINEEQITQLKNTLTIWGLLGGLGSRSRRAFGSVALKKLDNKAFHFKTSEQYGTEIRGLLNKIILAPEMPVFTALNEAMLIVEADTNKDAKRLMDKLGSQYQEARKKAGAGLAKLPFGLPLAGNPGASDEDNRRSSPLLMHIHPIDNQFVALISFIPADFHPDYPEGKQIDFYNTLQDYLSPMERVYP